MNENLDRVLDNIVAEMANQEVEYVGSVESTNVLRNFVENSASSLNANAFNNLDFNTSAEDNVTLKTMIKEIRRDPGMINIDFRVAIVVSFKIPGLSKGLSNRMAEEMSSCLKSTATNMLRRDPYFDFSTETSDDMLESYVLRLYDRGFASSLALNLRTALTSKGFFEMIGANNNRVTVRDHVVNNALNDEEKELAEKILKLFLRSYKESK